MLLTMVLSSREVKTKGFIKTKSLGWIAGWVGGGRCVRYGRIGGRRNGHKGGV
jgi:hypothetical protein